MTILTDLVDLAVTPLAPFALRTADAPRESFSPRAFFTALFNDRAFFTGLLSALRAAFFAAFFAVPLAPPFTLLFVALRAPLLVLLCAAFLTAFFLPFDEDCGAGFLVFERAATVLRDTAMLRSADSPLVVGSGTGGGDDAGRNSNVRGSSM